MGDGVVTGAGVAAACTGAGELAGAGADELAGADGVTKGVVTDKLDGGGADEGAVPRVGETLGRSIVDATVGRRTTGHVCWFAACRF